MSQTKEIQIPDLGSPDPVDVIEILVSVGDEIKKDDSLLTLESDKATMEVPSPEAGVVESVAVKVGDKVETGTVILELAATGSDSNSDSADVKDSEPEKAESATSEPAKQDAATASQDVNVVIPDIGGGADVDVIEIMVSVGDEISKDDSIITLEGEKATMEVPSSHTGKVKEIKVSVGDKVSEGSEVLVVEVEGKEQTSSTPAAEPKEAPSSQPAQSPAPAPQKSAPPVSEAPATTSGYAHASPAVRRIAREFGVDLTKVTGTGRKSRILKEDVQNYVKVQLAAGPSSGAGLAIEPAPEIDFSKFGDIETQPLNKIKRLTGKNVHRSWITVPHVTQFDEADITEMEAFRKENKTLAEKQGVKLTPLVFIMKAVVRALQQFPSFNSSLDAKGENLILKKYYNIGVAVDTPNGLVVPVVRDVDQKGFIELGRELGELSSKAREKGLMPNDMAGSTFTISSLGGIGGTAFTPIVNTPDVAILGVSKAKLQPVYIDGEFQPRLILPFSLSYDHRVIDGAEAARFGQVIAQSLADIRRLLL